jgi:hypothetical protein
MALKPNLSRLLVRGARLTFVEGGGSGESTPSSFPHSSSGGADEVVVLMPCVVVRTTVLSQHELEASWSRRSGLWKENCARTFRAVTMLGKPARGK